MSVRKGLAGAWAALVLLAGLWLWGALGRARLETSIFALVPTAEPSEAERAAQAAMRSQVEARFLILVGHAQEARAVAAAEAYAAALKPLSGVAQAICRLDKDPSAGLLDFYRAQRWKVLSAADERALFAAPGGLLQAAQTVLALPPGFSGSLGFASDPFGHLGRWFAGAGERAGKLQLRDGHLVVDSPEATWVAVLGQLGGARRGFRDLRDLQGAFEAARAQARAAGCQVLRAGFAFHEQKAAKEAHAEMNSIGSLSLGLLLALLMLAFVRVKPMLLALLPVAVGCIASTAVLLACYDKVHLAAVVFGSTIVGVAEDFGMHYLCGVYDPGAWDAWGRLRQVQRGISLALGTSLLGYAALFLLPLPGLHQIGLFAAVGLASAWLTVILCFPWLSRDLGGAAGARAPWARRLERAWPKVDRSLAARWALGLLAALALWGCLRLKPDDDLRLLYARDAALEGEQERATELAGLPRSNGFFVLRAADEQALLEKEEALLAGLEAAGSPAAAWQAVSHWVPSLKRQAQVHSLWDRALSPARGLEAGLGAPGLTRSLRRSLAQPSPALLPQAWLAQAGSMPYRYQWLGEQGGERASMILPSAQVPLGSIAQAQGLAQALPGVRWVDKAAETKAALGQLRQHLTWVLWVGFGLVLALLAYSFGRRAWRAALPTALGLACGLGALGLLGLPLNLFGLLALILVLGLGVDYGIYIQEAGAQPLSAFVAVNLAALTNIAAFGLLAFSGTPALKAFGLVLAVGTGVAWLSSPCFASSSELDHAKDR